MPTYALGKSFIFRCQKPPAASSLRNVGTAQKKVSAQIILLRAQVYNRTPHTFENYSPLPISTLGINSHRESQVVLYTYIMAPTLYIIKYTASIAIVNLEHLFLQMATITRKSTD
jgi:hypothetical protein